jgi:hypothetical protein
MSYLVLCVFDLRSGNRDDYKYVYLDLADIGLRRSVKSDGGPSFQLPGITVMGTIEGRSVEEVRTRVGKSVQSILKARSVRGDFFVVVSSDWACAGEST